MNDNNEVQAILNFVERQKSLVRQIGQINDFLISENSVKRYIKLAEVSIKVKDGGNHLQYDFRYQDADVLQTLYDNIYSLLTKLEDELAGINTRLAKMAVHTNLDI